MRAVTGHGRARSTFSPGAGGLPKKVARTVWCNREAALRATAGWPTGPAEINARGALPYGRWRALELTNGSAKTHFSQCAKICGT